MKKVLIGVPNNLNKSSIATISNILGDKGTVTIFDEKSDELLFDALIPEGHLIDKKFLDKCKSLKIIQCGAGFDNIDLKEASKRGIVVARLKDLNSAAVAEHTIALILALSKKLLQNDKLIRQGLWNDTTEETIELRGKTLGIIGYGLIGKKVAKLAKPFGLKILILRKNNEKIDFQTALEKLLKESDFITLHVPLNENTKHLISTKQLKLMKKSAFIINTSRGSIINQKNLVTALQNKRIAGAGIDVFEKEPVNKEEQLLKTNNTILTPHLAGATSDAINQRYTFFVNNILNCISHKKIENVVRKT
jgi:D-3-phosphoglycerate dehydrogenase